MNTPTKVVLTGTPARDFRAGKTVFLYDNKGQVISGTNGAYNSADARLPFCGAQLTEDGTASAHWRFCSDQHKGGCSDNPPSAVPRNNKLDAAQVQAIAHLLGSPDVSTKRDRALLQTQVWCVTERYSPGQRNLSAMGYFNTYQFGGGSSPESMRLVAEDVECAPWAEIPDTPEVAVTGPTQPVSIGEDAVFTVAANFTGQVSLYVTGSQPMRLCPVSQPGVALVNDVLSFAEAGVATVCIAGTTPGGMTLTARGDNIPNTQELQYLWNSDDGCQVFVDYGGGSTVDVTDRAGVMVLGTPGFELGKSADPSDGAEVNPGDTITYTLLGTNTGDTVLDPVVIEDDLSGLWEFVDVDEGSMFATVNGTDPSGDLQLDPLTAQLRWTGALGVGQAVTITYSVVVKANAVGQELENLATGSATPPTGPPIVPPPVDTEHRVPTPGFDINKTAAPAEGSTVNPGETIRYTVTGTNTGETVLDPVLIEDDLTGVLDFATWNDDVSAQINGVDSGTLSPITDAKLLWTGSLAPGETVLITYSVTVGQNADGHILQNRVTGSGTPPGLPPIVPPPVDTDHPVPPSGFETTKSATPASGSQVSPGDDIVYTVTGKNTGQTVLDPVVLEDDLRELWDFVAYNEDLFATINGSDPAGTLTLDRESKRATWTGVLAPNETVTIMYSVTVKPGAVGLTLANHLTGSGQPPGVPPIIPPPVDTEHPVPTPGFEMDKRADPESGTTVIPGDVIRYTVTGSNTGETTLDPVVLDDDLTGIWDFTAYNNDLYAEINGAGPAGTFLYEEETKNIFWTGVLNPGETVTITYSVTVNEAAAGQLLTNLLTGSAKPPGLPIITPPPVDTEHPVPNPGFEIAKSADPKSGSMVNPGDTIIYAVRGENTGDTVLDPVVLEDDLSDLWEDVTYNDDVFATINGEDAAGTLELDPETRHVVWTGALAPQETVTITYSVTVKQQAAGALLENRLSGSATPPGWPTITPPPVETEHPVTPKSPPATPPNDPTSSGRLPATGAGLSPMLGGLGLLLLATGVMVSASRRKLHSSR